METIKVDGEKKKLYNLMCYRHGAVNDYFIRFMDKEKNEIFFCTICLTELLKKNLKPLELVEVKAEAGEPASEEESKDAEDYVEETVEETIETNE